MAGSIPPLVSSSPPPLCAFDDDEEEDDDEFGMYNAVEEIDYNECITFKEKGGEKPSVGKSGGEQDSTSQDSATDSGLCPDSEGVSPTPHSDDERTVKQSACDRLCAKPSDLPVLLTPKCHSDLSNSLNTSSVLLQSIPHTDLPNGHVDVPDYTPHTESDDDFGNFEVALNPSLQLTKQGMESSESELNLRPSETDESHGLKDSTTGENLDEEQSTLNLEDQTPGLTVEFDKSDDFSSFGGEDDNVDPQNTFSSEFPAFEQEDLKDEQETKKESTIGDKKNEENITIDVKMVVENDVNQDAKTDDSNFENDDEFEDFSDFKASFSNSVDFPEPELSDRFSEHLKPFTEQEHSEEAAGKSFQVPQQDESDDEFSNFADFSSSDCAFVSAQSSNSLDNVSHIPLKPSDDTDLRTESDFQDWVSAFPGDVAEPSPGGGGGAVLLREDDVVWTRLFPLESSPALSYQWAESLANRRLLSALNIDSRNILFMPWSNSAVPRFAANLSCGPLEPVKATEPLQPAPQPTPAPQPASLPSSVQQESVPAAHFDWVSSGLTNPLDYPKPVLNLPKTLSTEAENILALLPDLSFMRKTYIDFPLNEG